jgi:hypothetical protein
MRNFAANAARLELKLSQSFDMLGGRRDHASVSAVATNCGV